jgi:polyketide cyclase/dehydrase/lipid transport protein
MSQVRVRMYIDAPVETVFDAASDHERFLRTDDGVGAIVVRPGDRDRNGLGCLREVRVGRRARYLEEITAWQRPVMFEYTIRESSLPLRHFGSRLSFVPSGSGTEVEWTSRFEVTVPLVGPLLGLVAARLYAASFAKLLRQTKARLERRP